MAATWAFNGIGTVAAGALLGATGARWIWGAAAVTFVLGAIAAAAFVGGRNRIDSQLEAAA
jgi:hypothetical protein